MRATKNINYYTIFKDRQGRVVVYDEGSETALARLVSYERVQRLVDNLRANGDEVSFRETELFNEVYAVNQ
jgi:hypothetical protein